MNRAGIISAALLAVLFLASCAGMKTPWIEPESKPFEGPVTVERLSENLAFSGISQLRSPVWMKFYRAGRDVGSHEGVLLFREPDMLSITVLNPFGLMAAELVARGGELGLHVPSKNVLYTGSYETRGVLPTALSLNEEGREAELVKTGEGYHLIVYEPDPGPYATRRPVADYFFHPLTLRNTGATIYSRGEPEITAEFEEFICQETPDLCYPRRVKLGFPGGSAIALTIEEAEVNGTGRGGKISGEAFSLEAGEGVRRLPIEELFLGPGL